MSMASWAANRDPGPLLLFSAQQGRQSNCIVQVEVARYLAERMGRRLLLPPCNTSPYGEQACKEAPGVPSQRQTLVKFPLARVMRPSDLSRCRAPAAAARPLVELDDLPVATGPLNVTCVSVGTRAARTPEQRALAETRGFKSCRDEMTVDAQLRAQLPLVFTSHAIVSAEAVLSGTAPASLAAAGHVYVHSLFTLFLRKTFGRAFSVCDMPRETETVLRMALELERCAVHDSPAVPNRSSPDTNHVHLTSSTVATFCAQLHASHHILTHLHEPLRTHSAGCFAGSAACSSSSRRSLLTVVTAVTAVTDDTGWAACCSSRRSASTGEARTFITRSAPTSRRRMRAPSPRASCPLRGAVL